MQKVTQWTVGQCRSIGELADYGFRYLFSWKRDAKTNQKKSSFRWSSYYQEASLYFGGKRKPICLLWRVCTIFFSKSISPKYFLLTKRFLRIEELSMTAPFTPVYPYSWGSATSTGSSSFYRAVLPLLEKNCRAPSIHLCRSTSRTTRV